MEKPVYEIVFKSYEAEPLAITEKQFQEIKEAIRNNQFIEVNDSIFNVSTIAQIRKIKEVIF